MSYHIDPNNNECNPFYHFYGSYQCFYCPRLSYGTHQLFHNHILTLHSLIDFHLSRTDDRQHLLHQKMSILAEIQRCTNDAEKMLALARIRTLNSFLDSQIPD